MKRTLKQVGIAIGLRRITTITLVVVCASLLPATAMATASKVTYKGLTYTCKASYKAVGGLDCRLGSRPPIVKADLYCDKLVVLRCSSLWYPSKFTSRDVLRYNSGYVYCKSSYSTFATYGEKACVRYEGGNPNLLSFTFPDVYCDTLQNVCNPDAYPSFWRKYETAVIDGSRHLCNRVTGDCWRWSSFSDPMRSVSLFPDMQCDCVRGCVRT
jgi:hypothetical protein